MALRLIILDFDGTLADTRLANCMAYTEALSEHGYTLKREDYLHRFFGMRCPEFLRTIGFDSPEEIDTIRRRKIELYPTYFSSVRLNTPLWEFCQSFRRQGGKVWIASTGQIANIRNAMRYLHLEDGIDGIITSDDVTEPKPSPECFLRAMEAVGATPSETLIFEDSAVGLAAAEASGAAFCRVDFDKI